jgi:hypothetical protein
MPTISPKDGLPVLVSPRPVSAPAADLPAAA